MLRVVWSRAARRRLRRLDAVTRGRVLAAVTRFATDGTGDVKSLVGLEGSRLRVGGWRIRFVVDEAEATMVVRDVKPRGDAY